MAATAWQIWAKAKKNIGNGTIKLGVNTLRMQLYTSAATGFTTAATLSTRASCTGEVTQQFGYLSAGKTLASVGWVQGTSVNQYKLSAASPVWSAAGGSITNIKYAMIRSSTTNLLCWSRLSTGKFNLTTGNTLTVNLGATGVFTLA